jgi:hypothetical protein
MCCCGRGERTLPHLSTRQGRLGILRCAQSRRQWSIGQKRSIELSARHPPLSHFYDFLSEGLLCNRFRSVDGQWEAHVAVRGADTTMLILFLAEKRINLAKLLDGQR